MNDISQIQRQKIIVIDDDALALSAFKRTLSRQGHQVTTVVIGEADPIAPADYTLSHHDLKSAPSLPKALIEQLRRADAILTDYDYRGGCTGLDFAERVRALDQCKDIPIFIHSNSPAMLYNNAAHMARAQACNIRGIFDKENSAATKLPAALTEIANAPKGIS